MMTCWQLSVLLLLSALSLSVGAPGKTDDPESKVDQSTQIHEVSHQEQSHIKRDHMSRHDISFTENSQSSPEKTNDVSKSFEKPRRLQGMGRKGTKRAKLSNKDLLHHLGMVKLRSPAVNHHRKRLASQSRKTHGHKNSGDSKMFVIKLPPNPYYYAHHDLPPKPNMNSLSVDFKNNGKPSRVYHWNIPVIKKMVARKAGSSGKSSVFADSDIFNIDKLPTWNDTDDDKSLYRKASFYAPKKPSKHPFRKYFAGNGKPHSFYLMENNSHKKSVHRLLP